MYNKACSFFKSHQEDKNCLPDSKFAFMWNLKYIKFALDKVKYGLFWQSRAFENVICRHMTEADYTILSYDVTSESVIKTCIKNDNPLVD